MWQEFCVENDYTPQLMGTFPNPAMIVARFISTLDVVSTPIYLIKEAMTAVKSLLEIANDKNLARVLQQDSPMIRDVINAATSGAKRHDIERSGN